MEQGSQQQGQPEPQNAGFWSAVKNHIKTNPQLQGALIGAMATILAAAIPLLYVWGQLKVQQGQLTVDQEALELEKGKWNQETAERATETATEVGPELRSYQQDMLGKMNEEDYRGMEERTRDALKHELIRPEDKAEVVQFLYGRNLVQKNNDLRVHLRDANLEKVKLYELTLSEADRSEDQVGGVDLSEAQLGEADMRLTKLSGANLSNARLREAYLDFADLSGIDLSEANVKGAHLEYANLSPYTAERGVEVGPADLSGACLREALLKFGRLPNANLSDTDLSGADLTDANLSKTDLSNAVYDSNTTWPQTLPDGEPFDPTAAGAVFEERDECQTDSTPV